jgi:hypothetical protein
MSIDYSQLSPGQTVSTQVCLLDAETVSRYIRAVGDRSPIAAPIAATGSGYVPPMAVAALSVRGVANDLQIPGGTLHLGQEIEFLAAVRIGESINCSARLSQNSLRGGRRILVVGLCVTVAGGKIVMSGKATISVPA